MEARTVFIVGDSLFAETLTRTLANAEAVTVIGTAPTLQAALPLLQSGNPDVMIVAGARQQPGGLGSILAAYPDLPVIRADLSANEVQVITSRRLGARTSDLLAAIAALPKRS